MVSALYFFSNHFQPEPIFVEINSKMAESLSIIDILPEDVMIYEILPYLTHQELLVFTHVSRKSYVFVKEVAKNRKSRQVASSRIGHFGNSPTVVHVSRYFCETGNLKLYEWSVAAGYHSPMLEMISGAIKSDSLDIFKSIVVRFNTDVTGQFLRMAVGNAAPKIYSWVRDQLEESDRESEENTDYTWQLIRMFAREKPFSLERLRSLSKVLKDKQKSWLSLVFAYIETGQGEDLLKYIIRPHYDISTSAANAIMAYLLRQEKLWESPVSSRFSLTSVWLRTIYSIGKGSAIVERILKSSVIPDYCLPTLLSEGMWKQARIVTESSTARWNLMRASVFKAALTQGDINQVDWIISLGYKLNAQSCVPLCNAPKELIERLLSQGYLDAELLKQFMRGALEVRSSIETGIPDLIRACGVEWPSDVGVLLVNADYIDIVRWLTIRDLVVDKSLPGLALRRQKWTALKGLFDAGLDIATEMPKKFYLRFRGLMPFLCYLINQNIVNVPESGYFGKIHNEQISKVDAYEIAIAAKALRAAGYIQSSDENDTILALVEKHQLNRILLE